MRFGRRKKKTGLVAETGKRSSQPNKGSREKPIPGEVGEAAERQRAKAGYRRFPELELGRRSSLDSGSFRREQDPNCACKDAQVQAQTPVFDVGKVKMHVEFERQTIPRRNLPETRDPGFNVKAPELVKFVMVDVVDRMRTRPNQAHLLAQHIPELRQLIEAVAADNSTDTGDSGVVVDLEDRALSLIAGTQVFLELCGVGDHGAKLVATEAAAFGACALRRVDDRTG